MLAGIQVHGRRAKRRSSPIPVATVGCYPGELQAARFRDTGRAWTNRGKQASGQVSKKLVLGDYEWLTYEDVGRQIDLIARGLLSIGAKPRQYLAILAETRAEWFMTAQACFRANIPLATLYAALSDDGIISAVNETEVTHLVTSSDLMPRLVRIVRKMPSLTHIIYMESAEHKAPQILAQGPQAVSFNALLERGAHYEAEMSSPSPEDVAIVMFTSGSSGKPKGVIATHGNLTASFKSFGAAWERLGLFTEFLLFSAGARIGYSSPLTLTDNSTGVAKWVPRGHDPPQTDSTGHRAARVAEATRSKGHLFQALFDYAIEYKNFWLDLGFETPLLNRLLFSKFRSLLGGEVKLIGSASAPLSSHTRRFTRACFCCPTIEGYGMTEVCGAATLMDVEDTSMDRVGAPISGVYVRLVDWTEGNYRTSDKPNPRGEIVIGGASVTKGYFKNEELTREVYQEEGGIRWCHTGDIGEFFPDGTLKIIDRKKDLVKLQHGEYISLGRVETILKMSPLVENAFAYGSSLHTYIVAFAKKAELPRKIKLCSEMWMPDSGLVTVTMKIRRKPIESFYQKDIDALYGSREEI
ncbi:hypothetical protein HPB48_012291 [Haemaphysalis longicornis]|uniref:long-chain-fatty-acid--CoA ligase n=1 Tax=Haemaphysalis longicornis TaxID=44386 RepID=A0A9J6GNC8_HAELO|nr:hypothetical protein HPB48_012291 [Haemaphysalis longicornis]